MKVLILIKSKDKLNFVNTASDSLKKYLEKDGYEVNREYLGNVNYVFGPHNNWSGFVRDVALSDYDIIYLQTAGSMKDQATLLTNYCYDKKIKLIEGNYLKTCSNSKLVQVLKCTQNNISIPKTVYGGDWIERIQELRYPFVAKNLLGKGGEGVSLVRSVGDFKKLTKSVNLENYIFQEFLPNEFDWRIVVVNNKVVYGCKRVRQNKADFRNNVKLGALEVLEEPKDELKKMAQEAAKAMNLTISGVDIIESGGKAYVIEINRSPSLPVNYDTFKGIPAVGEYIKKCLK